MLHEKYPQLSVMGDNYPPPLWRHHLAQILGILKFLVVMCVATGFNIFEKIGQPTPAFWNWLTTNKIYGCLVIFFLTNAIEGQLVSTGAFEINFNDVPVWSKLETGRIPQPPELFQIIDNHFRLDQTPGWSDTL